MLTSQSGHGSGDAKNTLLVSCTERICIRCTLSSLCADEASSGTSFVISQRHVCVHGCKSSIAPWRVSRSVPSGASATHSLMDRLANGSGVEVLWSVDFSTEQGRKCVSKSCWWRGVLSNVSRGGYGLRCTIEYDAQFGFGKESRKAVVRPHQVFHYDTGDNPLRWRICRSVCSPNRSLKLKHSNAVLPQYSTGLNQAKNVIRKRSDHLRESQRRTQDTLSDISMRLDEAERILASHKMQLSQFNFVGSESDAVADRIFFFLRHKSLVQCQKSVALPKSTTRSGISSLHEDGEMTSTGTGPCFQGMIRIDSDCSLKDFERVSRVIKSRCPTAVFEPPFPETQNPTFELNQAYVVFPSIYDLVEVLGIRGSDIQKMAVKGKKLREDGLSEDSAIRVLGSVISDDRNRQKPFAFLPGQSVHKSFADETRSLLYRTSRVYDFRNNIYESGLTKCRKKLSHIFRELEWNAGNLSDFLGDNRNVFCIKWRRYPPPSARGFSIRTRKPDEALGSLEVRWPFLTINGGNNVLDIQKVDLSSFFSRESTQI